MEVVLQSVQQRKILAVAIGASIVGLVVGLAIGWWFWPVQWTNAPPAQLRSDFRQTYVLLVAEDYAQTGDLDTARERLGLQFWDEGELSRELQQAEQAHHGQAALAIRRLSSNLEAAPAPPEAPSETVAARLQPVAMVCGVGLLVIALVGGGLYLYSRLADERGLRGLAAGGAPSPEDADSLPAEAAAWEGQPPNAQFATTYVLGDDRYDPSFSIELDSGEFMGECGIGISETIGADSPERVTALEVWLFDKNDIRTVTKVLMSNYAFNDEALRTKLAPKGEPILTEEGKSLILDTRMLRLRAHITELDYAQADLPPESVFDRLTVELAAWVKPQADGLEDRIPPGPPVSS